MAAPDASIMILFRAIAEGDTAHCRRMLRGASWLAAATLSIGASRQDPRTHWLAPIDHYVYAGDTALHVAAAAYSATIGRRLIAAGADPRATNRRGATPLHYAVDGIPGSKHWSPRAQVAIVRLLIEAGADPNALDRSGVSPLHRAIRNRCASAVEALIAAGANVHLANDRGSTAWDLAARATGRGGSGSTAAKREQARILEVLEGFRD